MRRITAILNPKSDRGRAAALVATVRAALSAGGELELRETGCRGEAVQLATQAAERGSDAVLAIGGDGTVHEVANGLMSLPVEARPTMGIIPAGSGNDAAFALGIPNDVQLAVDAIRRGHTRGVDVAEVRRPGAAAAFALNNVGTLLEGAINLLSHEYAWPRGSGLYVRAMLRTLLRPIPVADLTLTVDGVEQQRSAVLLSIANGPRSGGKFLLIPEAKPCDGRLNYVIAAPVGRMALLAKAARALRGQPLSDSWIERGAFATMAIRCSRALAVHVDGEPWLAPEQGCTELDIAIRSGALRILCPAD